MVRGSIRSSVRPNSIALLPFLLLFLLAETQTAVGQEGPPREIEIFLHDANPGLTGGQYLAGWTPERLATVQIPREGTATDGVSRLLVRVELPGPGDVAVEIIRPGEGRGTLASLSGSEAVQVGNRFFSFALYTPPAHFGPRSEADGLWHEEVDFRGVAIRARFTASSGRVQETGSAIILTRPPLVLVHGTFDNPVAAWRTGSDLGPAPIDAFSDAGFRPFTVDYSGSSAAPAGARTEEGGRITASWLNPGESSFRANRRVVLENPGGIRTALDHYRNQLGIAATKADVVGHSLGGTLGRVLASEEYNPDYRTAENFNQGWINRLITVNTPHHGTELPAMMSFFEEAEGMEGRTWTEWFLSKSIRLASWWAGRSASSANAVRDQLPLSSALDAIGQTAVPSHAVVGTMDISRLPDDDPTLALYTGIALAFYNLPGLFSDFLGYLAQERRALPVELQLATSVDGLPASRPLDTPGAYEGLLREIVTEPFDRESEYWLGRRDENWIMTVEGLTSRPQVPPGFLDTGFGEDESEYWILDEINRGASATMELGLALTDPIGLADQVVPYPLIDQFRDLIFRNDLNDGTVRLGSQTGGLDSEFVSRIGTPVVHSISPRYSAVQDAVIEVLQADGERMASGGFPQAGRQLPVWLPSPRLTRRSVEGDDAICWSGLVYDHAQAFAAVADSADAIVMARPVNPDATSLIARNIATKGMAVKGKSSNWGPQVGFIPQRQRFSKLWRNWTGSRRTAEITKYDAEVRSVVDKGQAELRELQLTFEGEPGVVYRVFEDSLVQDAAEAIRLVRDTDGRLESCDWRTREEKFDRDVPPTDCTPLESVEELQPLQVLADPGSRDANGTPRYLTADYDLLAIGFRDPPLPTPYLLHSFLPNHFLNDQGERKIPGMVLRKRYGVADTLRFDPVEGFITDEQSRLVDALNQKVLETGYIAGRVTHHGPENHYSGSPYVDYPITVFEPSREGPGRVLAIPMGPAGFRDIHLKRYILRKRQEGYNLVPNPEAQGWLWDTWGEFSAVTGWDPRDAPELPAYAAELSMPQSCVPIRQMPEEVPPLPEDSPPDLPPLEPILTVQTEAEPLPGREPDPGVSEDPNPIAVNSPPSGPSSDFLVTDDLTAFFQPARDTTETVWRWRFIRVGPAGDTARVRSGLVVPEKGEQDTTDRAESDAPAPFRTDLGHLWDETGPGPGTYFLQTCLPKAVPGVFGTTSGWAGCLGSWIDQETGEEDDPLPWQDEGSFEVADVELKLKGVVLEGGALPFPGDDRSRGRIRLEPGEGDQGASAILRVEWDACIHPDHPEIHQIPPCDQPDGWRRVRQLSRSRFAVDFPETLPLREAVPASFFGSFTPLEGDRQATAQLHDLMPRAGGPHRELAASGFILSLLDIHAGSEAEPPEERNAPNLAPMGVGSEAVGGHLHGWFPSEVGEPLRPTGEWIRDPSVHWYIPVEFSTVGVDVFAFIVYGAEPGPYSGSVPMAPGAVGPPEGDSIDPGDDPGDDPSGDPDVDPTGNDPEGGGPVDPNTLNPNDPDVSGLIREWIGVAQPPRSVEPDDHYVYDEWGRLVGSGADGTITPGDPPDARGTMGPPEYVWTQRDDLDSVDHCTVGEYVVRSLEGTGISDCHGRYRPSPRVPDFTGQPVEDVTRELESGGYTVNVSIADWPTNPDQANTVLRQRPAPGQRLRTGSQVDLSIYGPYQEPDPEPTLNTVLNVYGLRFEDARALLTESGFVVVEPPGGGDPAPTEDMAFRVAAQSVAGGENRAEGTEIRLTLFGPYNPATDQRQDDPPPPPPVDRGPSCNDLVMAANRAQSRGDLSGAYELYTTALGNGCTNPGLSDAREGVYQSPRCTQLIRTGRSQYDQGNFQAAIQALRDAEREGCDMTGLGPLIDGTLTALETGVAEEMGQSCSGIAAEIAAARRRGDQATAQALSTTALIQGCSSDQIITATSTPLGNQPIGGTTTPGTGGVTLTEPRSGLVTRERVIPVVGQVTAPGTERVTLVVNGEERQVSVANGEFSTMVPLITGQNTIQAVLNSSAYSNRVTVQADVAPADVWVQLTWDGPADIDLHLYMPEGGHVYFSNKEALGAQLDVDNTQQDGPEHITMTRAIPGEYRVEVHYYSTRSRPGGGTQVPWQVLVRLSGGQTAQRFSGVLTQRNERSDVYTFVFR